MINNIDKEYDLANLSKKIAFAVAKVSYQQKLALEISDEMLKAKIERNLDLF